MDMSLQINSFRYPIAKTHGSPESRVYEIEREQDMVIAEASFHSMGIYIDQPDARATEILEGL